MRSVKSRRGRLIFLAAPILILGSLSLFTMRQVRQARRNHALFNAIRRNDSAAARALLNQGADANARASSAARSPVDLLHQMLYRDTVHWTALMVATREGRLDIARALLDHGADVRASDRDGDTALGLAAAQNQSPSVAILLEKGAQVNAKDRAGVTPLMRAASHGSREAMQVLLAQGADVNSQDRNGRTALIWAMTYQQPQRADLVKALLASGADPNVPDNAGNTPLLWAAVGGHTFIVQMLLAHGANIRAQNRQGQTALMLAARDGYVDTVQALLQDGADIKATDLKGNTAMSYIPSGRTVLRGREEGDAYSEVFSPAQRSALIQSLRQPRAHE